MHLPACSERLRLEAVWSYLWGGSPNSKSGLPWFSWNL